MALPTLPTPPTRSDPANFAARADTFFAALPAWSAAFNLMVPAAVVGEVTGSLNVTGNATAGGYSSAGSLLANTTTSQTVAANDTLINANVASTNKYGFGARLTATSGVAFGANFTVASGTATYALWSYNGATVGSITSSGAATAYNTSSDYRLKDAVAPLTGSGAFIDGLQPKRWVWKSNGEQGVGFLAHEVQAVSPGSVVGQKDAVGVDGRPVYQAMEYGSAEFIANIIAELQSLRARVAALEG